MGVTGLEFDVLNMSSRHGLWQTVIFWAPAVEMVLTGSSGNGSLLGWGLGPLRQSAKLWLHDAGITHIHELVRIYFQYLDIV